MLALAGLGVADAIYLLAAHASGSALACPRFGWIDCDTVVSSRYSIILGEPLALWGLLGYLSVITLALWAHAAARSQPSTDTSPRVSSMPMLLARALTTAMATVSCYLVYLMVAVIYGLCLYCLGSFMLSLALFAVANFWPSPRGFAAFNGRVAIA
ncbi:MAG: vitamin K epoxide reductase family protein, partial [Cyanobacteria bacterium REEB65]|nr:vitamin K epoxide reductase family protein [Cyanobacteria bacterium REEB65]